MCAAWTAPPLAWQGLARPREGGLQSQAWGEGQNGQGCSSPAGDQQPRIPGPDLFMSCHLSSAAGGGGCVLLSSREEVTGPQRQRPDELSKGMSPLNQKGNRRNPELCRAPLLSLLCCPPSWPECKHGVPFPREDTQCSLERQAALWSQPASCQKCVWNLWRTFLPSSPRQGLAPSPQSPDSSSPRINAIRSL